jgi:thymidylate kinase
MTTDQSLLIVVDAGDGAGKSNVIRAILDLAAPRGPVFDLVAYTKESKQLPPLDYPPLTEAMVLSVAEPTYSWIGAAIRDEIIQNGRPYGGTFTAEAFALDRGVLYNRVVKPFLSSKPKRVVVQDRGVITSLAYQPIQDPTVTLAWMRSLEGNQIELSRPPDVFVYVAIDPEVAMARLANRGEKVDNHKFETLAFQRQLAARYRDPAVLEAYTGQGTRVLEINGNGTPEEVAAETKRLLAPFLA